MTFQHLARLNVNSGHILAINGVDMRRIMLRLLDNTGIFETSCFWPLILYHEIVKNQLLSEIYF